MWRKRNCFRREGGEKTVWLHHIRLLVCWESHLILSTCHSVSVCFHFCRRLSLCVVFFSRRMQRSNLEFFRLLWLRKGLFVGLEGWFFQGISDCTSSLRFKTLGNPEVSGTRRHFPFFWIWNKRKILIIAQEDRKKCVSSLVLYWYLLKFCWKKGEDRRICGL